MWFVIVTTDMSVKGLEAFTDGFTFILAAANGVVIATEKKLPSILVDETSVCNLNFVIIGSNFFKPFSWFTLYFMTISLSQVQKIQSLTPNIGVVYRFDFPHLLAWGHYFAAVSLSWINFFLSVLRLLLLVVIYVLSLSFTLFFL